MGPVILHFSLTMVCKDVDAFSNRDFEDFLLFFGFVWVSIFAFTQIYSGFKTMFLIQMEKNEKSTWQILESYTF